MALGRKPFTAVAGISSDVQQVLKDLGLTHATPVQEATIPLLCGHKDVAVDACTGSGKTLAFLIPIIEKLKGLETPLKKYQVGSLIISPTRELARQTFRILQQLLSCVPRLEASLLVGGGDPLADVATLKAGGAGVLVATPGRLVDVLERCSFLQLKTLEVLILDEADRLLDMGFRGHIDAIMARLPKQRRTGLFSATQTDAFNALARAGLRNPVRVNVAVTSNPSTQPDQSTLAGNPDAESAQAVGASAAAHQQRTPTSLQISYLTCEPGQKLGQLIRFLQTHRQEKVIVYMLTCACVDFWASVLPCVPDANGLVVHALHGRMKQRVRDSKLAAFRSSTAGCLLCTDVAARGLDIPDVAWTVQVDAPQDPDAFVHRVGRSARMGRHGRALVMLMPSEQAYVGFLRLRKIPLEETACYANAPDTFTPLRIEAESNRDAMDKSMRAFVSYLRAYKEHQCRFIFRVEELDLGRLAMSFALLRLPRMPELTRAGSIEGFTPSSVDPNSIKYKDKARQKQWVRKQQDRAAAAAEWQEQQNGSKRKEQTEPVWQKKLPSAKRRQLEARQDEADFAAEYTMLRKLKRGKLSEEDFDIAIGLGTAPSAVSQTDTEVVEGEGASLHEKHDKTKSHSHILVRGRAQPQLHRAARGKHKMKHHRSAGLKRQ